MATIREWGDLATRTVGDLEARYSAVVAVAGRLAMLGGAVAAAMPALGQLWRLEILTALATLGHAAAIAGLAASLGGRPTPTRRVDPSHLGPLPGEP